MSDIDEQLVRTAGERDFYLRLLELGDCDDPEVLMNEALALIVGFTGAARGYIELRVAPDDQEPRWSIAHGCSDEELDAIRMQISRGVIARAIANRETISTSNAVTDPRFKKQRSVQRNQIKQVLCAPIGRDLPRGVVYLQELPEPGPFPESHRRAVEIFARQVDSCADLILNRHEEASVMDHTRRARERFEAESIIGISRRLAAVFEVAAQVAPLDVEVLITGPSGTGKSQLARAIHENSSRTGPFVIITGAALLESLAESQLFGHKKGSFTGASSDKIGVFEEAQGGTLFLDEVGEIPKHLQAKLLRVLQERVIRPLGATREKKVDVRIISATNVDLQSAIRDGRFREDLYYRLCTFQIEMPALKKRRDDIPLLAEHFCAVVREKHDFPDDITLSSRALLLCREEEWPGNIRQLRLAIQRAVIGANSQKRSEVVPGDIFPDMNRDSDGDEARLSLAQAVRQFKREFFERTLETNDWNIIETAEQLDVARSYVYKLISAFGLQRTRE